LQKHSYFDLKIELKFLFVLHLLNAVTQPITYPLPRLDDVFDAIGQANATIYTKLDLTSAYFQLGLDDKSKLMELQFLHNLLHISYNSRLIPEMI
jgi:hypothetical protein